MFVHRSQNTRRRQQRQCLRHQRWFGDFPSSYRQRRQFRGQNFFLVAIVGTTELVCFYFSPCVSVLACVRVSSHRQELRISTMLCFFFLESLSNLFEVLCVQSFRVRLSLPSGAGLMRFSSMWSSVSKVISNVEERLTIFHTNQKSSLNDCHTASGCMMCHRPP